MLALRRCRDEEAKEIMTKLFQEHLGRGPHLQGTAMIGTRSEGICIYIFSNVSVRY